MIRLSSESYYDNIARNGDYKFCAESVFIRQNHSIMAQVYSQFGKVRHFGKRSSYITSTVWYVCSNTQLYSVNFGQAHRLAALELAQ